MPRPSEGQFLLALALLAPPGPPSPPPALEAEASLEAGEGASRVVVELHNTSLVDAIPVGLEGELRGAFATASLPEGVKAGERSRLVLPFPGLPPGSFPVAVRLTYPSTPRGSSVLDQLVCLSVGSGGARRPGVSLAVRDLSLETAARWPITLRSVDGAPHRVVVRVEAPKGLGVSPAVTSVEVGPRDPTRIEPRLFRGSIPRGAAVKVFALAELQDPVPGALVESASVRILPDPAVFPRLRVPLLILAAALLASAFGAELWALLRRSGEAGGEPPGP